MKKFVSNYLISDTGAFLKNGIAIANEFGFIDQYIDTTGNLKELEQLAFCNGILMAGYQFVRNTDNQLITATDQSILSIVLQSVGTSVRWSIQNHIDLGKSIQLRFPSLTIPVILNEMTMILVTRGEFTKETLPGIYLLQGADLAGLHFKPNSRLKKIL